MFKCTVPLATCLLLAAMLTLAGVAAADDGDADRVQEIIDRGILDAQTMQYLKSTSLRLFDRGTEVAAENGLIMVDTKYEFGRGRDGKIMLIDEVMTPDSSRFWPADTYEPGHGQPSLDKQPVRDYLEEVVQRGDWDRTAPAPSLAEDVVTTTSERYREAFRRVTGHELYE